MSLMSNFAFGGVLRRLLLLRPSPPLVLGAAAGGDRGLQGTAEVVGSGRGYQGARENRGYHVLEATCGKSHSIP